MSGSRPRWPADETTRSSWRRGVSTRAYTYDWIENLLGLDMHSTDRFGMLATEPASLVMERKMLRGIKERAERLAADGPLAAPGDPGARLRVGTDAA